MYQSFLAKLVGYTSAGGVAKRQKLAIKVTITSTQHCTLTTKYF
jgi:hypothetical protein